MYTTRSETSGKSRSNAEPHYIFHTQEFRKNLRELYDAYTEHYKNFAIGYSFKTNYLKAACKSVLECGGYAEVVSHYEYEYARLLGFPDSRIIWNGVIPSEKKITVLLGNGMVNVDSLGDYERIERAAKNGNLHVQVGIRVNLDSVMGTESRFGIDMFGPDFEKIIKRIRDNRNISLAGFHSHVHGIRDVRYWEKRAAYLAKAAKEYGAGYIDLGGGMWGKMPESLMKQFSRRPNTYAEYGEAIGKLFASEFPDNSVKLIVEPGIGLIGNAMDCVSHVTGIKRIGDREYVQLDINGAATAFDYNCDANRITKPFHIIRTGTGKTIELANANLVGTTCTEIDVLVRGFKGELSVGDTIVFENIGAYSLVTARQFITPRLGVYDADTGKCLRKAEDEMDMFRGYLRMN